MFIQYFLSFITVIRNNLALAIIFIVACIWLFTSLLFLKAYFDGISSENIGKQYGITENTLYIWGQQVNENAINYDNNSAIIFKQEDLDLLKQQFPEIANISPRIYYDNTILDTIIFFNSAFTFNIVGEHSNYFTIENPEVFIGRPITKNDINDKTNVCIIGIEVFNELSKKNALVLNNNIQINSVDYKVIGVIKSSHTGLWKQWQDESVILPITSLQELLARNDEIDFITIKIESNKKQQETHIDIINYLKKIMEVQSDDNQSIGYFYFNDTLDRFRRYSSTILFLLIFISTVLVISIFIGIRKFTFQHHLKIREGIKSGIQRVHFYQNYLAGFILAIIFASISFYIGYVIYLYTYKWIENVMDASFELESFNLIQFNIFAALIVSLISLTNSIVIYNTGNKKSKKLNTKD